MTGKAYQSNKKSYHKIRFQSDELCKEYGLSVIDEYYEAYKIRVNLGTNMNKIDKENLGNLNCNLI